jgi:hypothetical protein
MSLTVANVFGAGSSLDGSALTIPTDNLSVISGVSADYSNGAEAVFALLEHLAAGTPLPLTSGNITSSVSTNLVSGNRLRKTYTFTLTVGDIELNSLDVV